MPSKPQPKKSKKNKDSETEHEQGEDAAISTPQKSTRQRNESVNGETTPASSTQVKIGTFFKTPDTPTDLANALQKVHEKLDKIASQEYMEGKFKEMLTEELLMEKLSIVKTEIKENIQREVKQIYTEMEKIKGDIRRIEQNSAETEGKLFEVETTVERVETKLGRLEKENGQLKDRVAELMFSNNKQMNDTNDLEQYTRRNSTEFTVWMTQTEEKPNKLPQSVCCVSSIMTSLWMCTSET